jgi:plastocyanin
VKAGAPITVKFTNNDPIIHNFSVYDKKGGTELFTGDLFKGPNVTKEEHFTAPAKPGDYYFQCDVHPDTMFGTLVVQ